VNLLPLRRLASVALIVCGLQANTIRAADEPRPAPANHAALAKTLLDLHNAERAPKGSPPLRIDSRLSAAAQGYADFLARSGKFGHGSQGNPGSRARQQGYRYLSIGENIAKGQATPAMAMKSWMKSSGHRANILRKTFQDTGFGVATTPDGQLVWVANFGSR
jgi:uncharacterized protein YkwD